MSFDTSAGTRGSRQPRFLRYQEKTDRELPIIHLVPRSGQ
jgi:hypothetical protein